MTLAMVAMPAAPRRVSRSARFARAVGGLAGLKLVVAPAAIALVFARGVPGPNAARAALELAHTFAFALAGLLLILGGRTDRRAQWLGVAFLLIAAVFADPLIAPLRAWHSPLVTAVRALLALQVDAFTPYFVWRFVRVFPRAPLGEASGRRFAAVTRVCLAVGIVLLIANLAAFATSVWPDALPPLPALRLLSRHTLGGVYWSSQFALLVAALVVLVIRARRASLDERRRVRLLVAGLALGTLPTLLWVLATTAPPLRALLPLRIAGWVTYPTLLSTPFTTAYAVLAHRALDVRLVIRHALQYALARYTLLAAAAVPFLLLAGSVYQNREASIAALLSSKRGLLLGGLAVLGIVAWRWQARILVRLDHRYFREQHDARVVLRQLVDRCSDARDVPALTAVLRAELDRALHPDVVHALVLDERMDEFVASDGDIAPLGTDSSLATWLGLRDRPIDIDLERPSAAVAALAEADRIWLADAGARLVVPIHDTSRRMVALLTLGEKKSEQPYMAEDRTLLQAVGAAVRMALQAHKPRTDDPARWSTSIAGADDQPAAECVACGSIYPHDVNPCVACGGATRRAVVPQTVAGKFAMHRRIGAGAMGVVYQGVDLTLDRTIAIKTLPFVSLEDTVRMRREARAMAAVTHENLATIYTAETWHGRPMLVVEYLGGGTLADRLVAGPVAFDEAIELGIALATGLKALHRVGVVHGDIKPSNIGFTFDGTPKLLDFGLASIVPAGGLAIAADADRETLRPLDVDTDDSASQSIAFGTPRYMAPEARAGAPPSAAGDLWSLGVVLHEAITGRHPFHRADASNGGPDLPADARSHAPELTALFHDALTPHTGARLATADALRDRLERLRPSAMRAAT